MSASWHAAVEAIREHLLFDASHRLLDHWVDVTTPGSSPDRRDIDPICLTGALEHLFLVDLIPEGRRLQYRLAGEEINSRYETSIVGRHLDEITPPDAMERVLGYFRACPERQAIVLLSGILFAEREHPSYGERLLLPLKDREDDTVGLIGITRQSEVFPSKASAQARAKRTLRIAPLDGSPIEEVDQS